MHIKRHIDFINENDDFKKSVTSMNKFGIDNPYGNWVVSVMIHYDKIDLYKFFTKEEALNKILNIFNENTDESLSTIEDLNQYSTLNGKGFSYDEDEILVIFDKVTNYTQFFFDISGSVGGSYVSTPKDNTETNKDAKIYYAHYHDEPTGTDTVEFFFDEKSRQEVIDDRALNHWKEKEIGVL